MRGHSTPKILVSAYACRPGSGSEPGAGYALLRAAASIGECWVLTRNKHTAPLRAALDDAPTRHAVTIEPVDAGDTALRLKRRTRNVRGYYTLWQLLAARRAAALDAEIDFDVLYHATFSTFWLPVGLSKIDKPLVLGPVSGGCNTPPQLIRHLSPATAAQDALRFLSTRSAGLLRRLQWRHDPPVVLAQEHETRRYLQRHVLPAGPDVRVHPHATQPDLGPVPAVASRSDEIVFAGRLLSWKGTSLALRAFAAASLPTTRLVYFGEGPDGPRLRRMARDLGILDAVEFAGMVPRDDLLRRLRASRALLFPSFHDSAGFVVSEALTLGVPVICLDHGGPGALVRFWPDVPHTAVPPSDPQTTLDALTHAVRDYARDPRPIPDGPQLASATLAATLRTAFVRAGVPVASADADHDGAGHDRR